jgi:hypothetical protein
MRCLDSNPARHARKFFISRASFPLFRYLRVVKEKSVCACEEITESCASVIGPLLDTREVAFVIVQRTFQHSARLLQPLQSHTTADSLRSTTTCGFQLHNIRLHFLNTQPPGPNRAAKHTAGKMDVQLYVYDLSQVCGPGSATTRTAIYMQGLKTDMIRVLHEACRGSFLESRSMLFTIPLSSSKA